MRRYVLASLFPLATISVQPVEADGSIVAWGFDYHGQCNVPGPDVGFVAVAARSDHSLGIREIPANVEPTTRGAINASFQ
jgi:hypothetical protein